MINLQKKIIKIIVGYILFMCVVGVGLLIKHQFDNIPIFDDALIEELLESTELPEIETGEAPVLPQDSSNDNVDKENKGDSYWENYYQESEIAQEEKNPVISQIQKQITTGDKLRIIKIIKKNLSSDEIKYILSLVKDGFTNKEQIEVKSILQQKIGTEEKQELKDILFKYL